MTDLVSMLKKRNAYASFAADVDKGLSHAYLFICDDSSVRSEFLPLVAKRIFCRTACGECRICRLIEEGNYFDVSVFDGAEMKVKDINELTETAQIKPVEGDKKVYIINNADKLTAQAQNKLLKTYEEPPAYLTIILAAADENNVLPTIKSRAKKLYFDALTSDEIVSLLIDEGTGEREAKVAAAVSSGSLDKAEKFLSNENYANLYDSCFRMFLTLTSSSQIVDWLYDETFNKDNINMTLDFMEIILSDVMIIQSGSTSPLKNSGRDFDLREIANKFNAQSAAMSLYAINEGRKKLNFNVSSVSVAEKILFDILEARYKWQ